MTISTFSLLHRKGLNTEALKRSFLEWLVYAVGKDGPSATKRDWFHAVALAVRDRVVDRWMLTTHQYADTGTKRVYYLSLEFLIGRLLNSNLVNLDLQDLCREALTELGISLDDVLNAEPDAALGNGGLGRLAACFLDSMATLDLPGYGYGIRYEFGLFEQRFDEHGRQVEQPEQWLQYGNPWEFARPEASYPISFYGRADAEGRWLDCETVLAMAYDTPVVGFGGETINTLRLWSAKATRDFNFNDFNEGNYLKAVESRVAAESLTRVLYPNDATEIGRELRLRQEYFFTSASLQDILRRHIQSHPGPLTVALAGLPQAAAIQLNDTHPAIGIAEMMHQLMDHYDLDWDTAWDITNRTFSYTNHTLMPEALEAWPVSLMERVLPRHMQIIFGINDRFLLRLRQQGRGDPHTDWDVLNGRLSRLSLIDENGGRRVRMGHLAFLGSHKVNGVSALHTDLMKKTVFADFHHVFPDRIVNMTNGITPRRWLMQANPGLTALINERIGTSWHHDLTELAQLRPFEDDAGFRDEFRRAKAHNKQRLADHIAKVLGVAVNVDSLFDVQVKRIHEYKRQLLNLLQTVALYNDMRTKPEVDWLPITKIFGGKAAPGYAMAKLHIKLINDVAQMVNHDPAVRDLLKIIYLPNYNVTQAEIIIPAADLSEQISTAGMEASGTGNMKLALNGALTIGTLDGANVEIREAVGPDNIFIFGLDVAEVAGLREGGGYNPVPVIEANPALREALAMIGNGYFSPDDPDCYRPIIESLTAHGDHFLVTADFADYVKAQENVAELYRSPEIWTRKTIINTAAMGWFSSDRTVQGYADEIWGVTPLVRSKAAE